MTEIEIMYRQLAPYIKNFFDQYSSLWGVPFHDVYLTCRYRPGVNMDEPNAALVEVRVLNKDFYENVSDKEGKKQMDESTKTLLSQMFPIFKDEVIETAKEWKCTNHDVYLMVFYEKGKEATADTLGLQLRTRTDKKLIKNV